MSTDKSDFCKKFSDIIAHHFAKFVDQLLLIQRFPNEHEYAI